MAKAFINLLHVGRATLQVASRDWVIRRTDLEAVKKELEFCRMSVKIHPNEAEVRTCRRRLNGRHDLKVLLLKKDWKKVGQEALVKLFPRLVSKGLGRGEYGVELATVMDGAVDDDAAVRPLDGATVVVDNDDGDGESTAVEVDTSRVDTAEGSPPWRGCRSPPTRGGGCRSKRISPLRAICANVDLRASRPPPSAAIAVVHSNDRNSIVEYRKVSGTVRRGDAGSRLGRRLPGRGRASCDGTQVGDRCWEYMASVEVEGRVRIEFYLSRFAAFGRRRCGVCRVSSMIRRDAAPREYYGSFCVLCVLAGGQGGV